MHAGYAANNAKFVVTLDNGDSAFVKAATDEMSAECLVREIELYAAVDAPFMPRVLGGNASRPLDPEDMPYLILEDLSRALWPPPWDDAGVAAVLATLEDVAVTPPPEHVPEVLGTSYGASFRSGWDAVVADPEPLLRLGASSRYWLDAHVETLRAAAHAAPVEGDALLHMDVRSDNLCLRGGRAILVDWNLAARGNPLLDVAFWLPALALESGKPPHEVAPATAPFAACVAAFFACRAGLPPPPTAPTVREFQLAQLGVALPWAARVLDLPPPV